MVRSKLKFLLGMCISFLVVMVLLEAYVRLTGTSIPPVVTVDEHLGQVMKRNRDVVFVNEGFKLGRINQYGYFGRAYPPKKPAGVVRIALMGDSYVAGHQLFDRDHFGRILENGLNRDTSRRVEVLNFGFPALNFEQMYLYYEEFARKFSPDLVVYVVGASSLNKPSDEIRPKLVVSGDSVSVDYSFRSNRRFARMRKLRMATSFGLYTLVRMAGYIYKSGKAPEVIFDKFYRLFKSGGADGGDEYTEPVERPKRQPINRAVVKLLGEANRAGSPKSIIVARGTLPETFVDYVKANDVIYLDPSAPLDSLAQSGIDPNYWAGSQRRGHWNQYAHRVIGAFLIKELTPFLPKD